MLHNNCYYLNEGIIKRLLAPENDANLPRLKDYNFKTESEFKKELIRLDVKNNQYNDVDSSKLQIAELSPDGVLLYHNGKFYEWYDSKPKEVLTCNNFNEFKKKYFSI